MQVLKRKEEIISIVTNSLIQVLELDSNTDVQLNSHLRDDLGLDSLSSMEFLVYLEDEIQGFIVNAETIEAKSFNTVETISNYVFNELKQTAPTTYANAV